jgi:hypothetical protein
MSSLAYAGQMFLLEGTMFQNLTLGKAEQ